MPLNINQNLSSKTSLIVILGLGGLFLAIITGWLEFAGAESNEGPGYIIEGENSILNPDGGDYMSGNSDDGSWTITANEYSQFEQLAGKGGANRKWEEISTENTEPTGLEDPNDTHSGGSCGNADITVDSDGGYDYGYYTVIDPSKSVDGDEILAVALRISDVVSGNYAFSMMVDAENDCGSDINAVCGNPCFEYEILILSDGKVRVINIDGCSGTSDCDALHGTSQSDGKAYVCKPCNEGAMQVMAGSGACPQSGLEPVFWMAHVNFSQLPGVDPKGDFKLVPATTTSSNSVIYKGTNIADYGGIGDPGNSSECDCAALCDGNSCSDCIRDCALACASKEGPITFPVEWLSFEGSVSPAGVELNWITAWEQNNDYFEVERLGENSAFAPIGQVEGSGTSDIPVEYSFVDPQPNSGSSLYRIKQVDKNGDFSYSSLVEVGIEFQNFEIQISTPPGGNSIVAHVKDNDQSRAMDFRVMTLNGATVFQKVYSIQPGSSSHNLPVGRLSKGIYIFQALDGRGGKTHMKKFQIR